MVPRCAQTDANGTWIDMVGAWTDICHRHCTWVCPDGTQIDMVGAQTDI